jgi:hypothetical protein
LLEIQTELADAREAAPDRGVENALHPAILDGAEVQDRAPRRRHLQALEGTDLSEESRIDAMDDCSAATAKSDCEPLGSHRRDLDRSPLKVLESEYASSRSM